MRVALDARTVIVVADDHPLFRGALARAVRDCFPRSVLHETGTLEGVRQLLRGHAPVDLLIMELNLPDAHGMQSLQALRQAHPELSIMVVSGAGEPGAQAAVLRAGAAAYVPKTCPPALLREALRAVGSGEVWARADAAPSSADRAPTQSGLAQLTPQQRRVLELLSRGLLNKQIAAELEVAEATVKSHVTAIMRKLGAHNRTQAVVIARTLADAPQPGE